MRRRAQRGFTLIEMMVAIVVSAIVVLGVFAFANIQRANATAFERNVRIQQALEGAMWTIGQDVRQAGLGFTRMCTELRVWDAENNRLINPGVDNPNNAVVDAVTGERYWVLRDGLQAHWLSEGAGTLDGGAASSAAVGSGADSFDVLLGEPTYSNAVGVFHLAIPIAGGDATLVVETSNMLSNATHLPQVQQLFPPGTFVVVARRPGIAVNPVSPGAQGQCVLLQVTGDVLPDADPQRWQIPIGNASGFNADLAALVADDAVVPACTGGAPACVDDWDASTLATAMVVPVGRLRWSRYELDYFIPTLPYLVRYDLIGWRAGDLNGLGGVAYPHCAAGQCNAPQLHLPGSDPGPSAVAIAPMVEDMQVAVGCDGWSSVNAAAVGALPPDVGFEELGPAEGALLGLANVMVDENRPESGQRNIDEWLGNALVEQSAPDCVAYGTAEGNASAWSLIEPVAGPPFRMSPQTMRVTLMGSDENDEATGGLATALLPTIEDRPELPSLVGTRQRFTLTERYAPENLHWRDSTVR